MSRLQSGIFKDFATYVRLFDGSRKPKLDFREMYKLFPQFTFTASPEFGSYENFGEAYEAKILNMTVSDNAGNECVMTYKVYGDADENLAYVS